MAEEYKRFKDPIYGYIEINSRYMKSIVDTACFQRLRNVIQTSYSPLYSAAVHNRFIHSLGVFHLGQLAIESVEDFVEKENVISQCEEIDFESVREMFLLACLLHDVGHAPFSHTGEDFYLDEGGKYSSIHQLLIDMVEDSEFERDVRISEEQDAAKPHEIMSAIIGLKMYPNLFETSKQKSFFARCITGYSYRASSVENSFYNCIISLLNSSIIDVDKLDYLIRDAYITGFDSVKIDYVRLLRAIWIIFEKSSNSFILAYDKSALSVIESVIFAHDAERHWIQNHPVVVYETYLLKSAVTDINHYFSKSEMPLFSLDSLLESGNIIESEDGKYKMPVRLLTDDDVIFLMKNIHVGECATEYFSRENRRHAAWKSEAEYKAIFYRAAGRDTTNMHRIEMVFGGLSKFVSNVAHSDIINEETMEVCRRQREELDCIPEEKLSLQQKEEKRRELDYYLKWFCLLENFAKEERIPFDFLFLKADQFNSGFQKDGYGNTRVYFRNMKNYFPAYKDIITPMTSTKSDSNNFYYLFYRRKDEKQEVNFLKLVKGIMHTIIDLDEIYEFQT